jgi:tetratricopeptide (TPR) repeat protein
MVLLMKESRLMRRALAAVVLVLTAAALSLAQTNEGAAREELNVGARLYRAGQFAEAEQHFRCALELDPAGRNTRLFIARAVQQQYRPGDTSPENVAQAERAIEAYAVLLADERFEEDAYKATVFLYWQLKRDDKVVEMLRRRAEDATVSDEKRAEAFVILASRKWQCSYEITERKENKRTEQRPHKILIRYRRPADPADFDRARGCADEGLRLSARALALDPDNAINWSYQANLLREEAKLAEMAGDAARKNVYNRRYREALDRQKRLEQEEKRKRELKREDDSTAAAGPHS